jgi:hypothetical protein
LFDTSLITTAEEMAQNRNSPRAVTPCESMMLLLLLLMMMTIAMKVEVIVLVFSCEVKTVA